MASLWLVAAASWASAVSAAQPSAPSPIAAPLRELPWGQLNFLHTTDTHGWHGGHLQEPSYAADWGDYISLAQHLRDRADADGSDLLLIDTGDRVEGNGLYDASEPKGLYTFDIVKEQHIDLICSGNHELYKQNSSENELFKTVPNFRGNYLASNLDIYNPETGSLQPLAPRFKKFTTKNQGIRILAFGFLFDFTGNANNTVVQPVEETVHEPWFLEALHERDVDLIIVIGHVAIRSEEYKLIYKTIRSIQWDTPIQFFGGHTHIRDYVIFDSKSVALESGRYMETIGFQSISGLPTNNGQRKPPEQDSLLSPLTFSRLYLDNNLYSHHHHTGLNSSTFPTPHGLNVSQFIASARKALRLDERYGCSPATYWVSRAPYPSPSSIFSLLTEHVLPEQFAIAAPRVKDEGRKAIAIINTGAMRFDILEGPVTRDTALLVSPFTSGVRYLKDIPLPIATKIIKLLNNEGPILAAMSERKANVSLDWKALAPPEQRIARPPFPAIEDLGADDRAHPDDGHDGRTLKLVPGYTTVDDAGADGDDTLHRPVRFYDVPNCVQAGVGFDLSAAEAEARGDDAERALQAEEVDEVDVAYNEFIQPYVLLALEYLGHPRDLAETDWFVPGSFTDQITEWVRREWPCDGGDEEEEGGERQDL